MLREALKKSYQAEKEKLKKMNRSEKVSYIWMYYKVPIFVILIVIAGTTGILWNILHNQETVYSLAIVNETMNMERDTELSEQLEQYFGLDQKKEKIVVDSNYNISYQFDDTTNQAVRLDGKQSSDYSTYEKFFLNLAYDEIDATVMPEGFLQYCNELEICFEDLRNTLSEETLQRYQERFCYQTNENGERYPCGIYMDGTVFDAAWFAKDQSKEVIESYGKQVLVFTENMDTSQKNELLVQYVLETLMAA